MSVSFFHTQEPQPFVTHHLHLVEGKYSDRQVVDYGEYESLTQFKGELDIGVDNRVVAHSPLNLGLKHSLHHTERLLEEASLDAPASFICAKSEDGPWSSEWTDLDSLALPSLE